MPVATKKRKVSSSQCVPAARRALDAFTRVSKAGKIAKNIIEKNDHAASISATLTDTFNSRKRKIDDSEEEESSPESVVARTIKSASSSSSPILPLPTKSRIPQTPSKPILVGTSPASGNTPTKGARTLLDRFSIAKTPTKSPLAFNSSNSELIASTPQKPSSQAELPIELVDLINLHAAFLTALSIHYAHNGTHSPADLRILCPDVARAWGKRAVKLEDIRRILGILNINIDENVRDHQSARLTISDYGHGKICIEIQQGRGRAGSIARPINEDRMNRTFEQGLLRAWAVKTEDISIPHFIEGLPMESITACTSLLKISPLLAKGQRRLEDLKAGILLHKENKATPKVIETAPDGKKLTLLERLRAKQLETAKLPPPPTKEQLARKQALQRIEEVVAVLSILSTSSSIGQQRISFTMATVIGTMRDSFKTPISKIEANACVQLLAAEIAPEWVKIVKMGRSEALVVDRDGKLTDAAIQDRLAKAM